MQVLVDYSSIANVGKSTKSKNAEIAPYLKMMKKASC
jgi:hypothetical protein